MAMKKTIVGNWKMNGAAAMAHPLALAVAAAAADVSGAEVVVCPPATLLTQVVGWLVGSNVKVGGQDCSSQPYGAYTGDISAAMLHEAGCEYVIVGHSERRQHHQETNDIVRDKAAQAMKTGLVPIICVGETGAERESGKAEEVVGRQVKDSLPLQGGGLGWGTINELGASGSPLPNPPPERGRGSAGFLLAYEPVWAIGSGKTPVDDDIWRMHAYILSVASKQTGLAPGAISVLYGGSVNGANAKDILATEHVAGVLVGGASLKEREFTAVIAAAV